MLTTTNEKDKQETHVASVAQAFEQAFPKPTEPPTLGTISKEGVEFGNMTWVVQVTNSLIIDVVMSFHYGPQRPRVPNISVSASDPNIGLGQLA